MTQKHALSYRVVGNLVIVDHPRWKKESSVAPVQKRAPKSVFLVIITTDDPRTPWTIGWVQAHVGDANENQGRIRTILKNGWVLPHPLPNEDGYITYRLDRITSSRLRQIALSRVGSIAMSATHQLHEVARRHGRSLRTWDIASTRKKLEEADVLLERLA